MTAGPRSVSKLPVSNVLSVLAILACGTLGALAGYASVTALGWSGTFAAIVATAIGMVVATGAWIAGAVVLRKLGWLR